VTKKIDWREQAKREMRAIDQVTAMRILHGVARYLKTGYGNVKQLTDVHPPEFRLRIGDYRVRYEDHGDFIFVLSVSHRRETYR
jgi:mRNA interferase RelE/StbE